MSKNAQASSKESIDPALIAAIAREVIARLRATSSKTNENAVSISDRTITVDTLDQLTGTPTQLFIASNSIVTPAARDEARQRGITFNRTVDVPPNQQPNHARLEITDAANPERASAVRAQLARRGLNGSAKIVLSDTPARDLYQQCVASGEIAVMITTLTDIQRFADELSPTLWVLDMKRLNLPAAVNAIAQITQIGNSSR